MTPEQQVELDRAFDEFFDKLEEVADPSTCLAFCEKHVVDKLDN